MIEENIVSYLKASWQINSFHVLVDPLSVSFIYIRADSECFVGFIKTGAAEYPGANLRMVWRSATSMLAMCG